MSWWNILKLYSRDPQTRISAAKSLASKKYRSATMPLIRLLEDKNPIVQVSAIYSLGQIGDKRSIKPLEKVLRNTSFIVQREASLALNALGWTPSESRDRALLAIVSKDWDEVRRLSDDAIQILAPAINHEKFWVKSEVIQALGEIRNFDATKILTGKGYDEFAQREVWKAFENITEHTDDADLLIEIIDNGNYRYIAGGRALDTAIERLSENSSDRVIDALISILEISAEQYTSAHVGAIRSLVARKNEKAVYYSARILYEYGHGGYYRDLVDAAASGLKELGAITSKLLVSFLQINELEKDKLERAFIDQKLAISTLTWLEWKPKTDDERALWAIATADWKVIPLLGVEAISALIANSNAPEAGKVAQLLEEILKQHATNIKDDDLKILANIEAKTWMVTEGWVSDWDGVEVLRRSIEEEVINCTEIHRLAKNEIMYRQAKT